MEPTVVKVRRSQVAIGCLVFRVDQVDNEVRLYWGQQLLFVASKASALPQVFAIAPRRRYTIRYNNNDGAGGVLRCGIALERGGVGFIEVLPINLSGLFGPTVIECPFLVKLE